MERTAGQNALAQGKRDTYYISLRTKGDRWKQSESERTIRQVTQEGRARDLKPEKSDLSK